MRVVEPPASCNTSGVVAQQIGRYLLLGDLASGGMGTVHVGRLRGEVGFGRTVAIKRLHPHMANDPELVAMLLDEARIASRVRHPNVVSTIDVVSTATEVALVMDLVHGADLSAVNREIWAKGRKVPAEIAAAIVCGVLTGLHDAHEASDECGRPLQIVHRDVSPQNVLVGADGLARVADFGVAKAALRASATRDGQIRGKIAYMPPEQILGHDLDRRADVYATAVVLWETLAGRRLFEGDAMVVARKVVHASIEPPSAHTRELPAALDTVVMRGLARSPNERFDTAFAMAAALESAVRPSSAREVAAWLDANVGARLRAQREWVAALEQHATELTAAGPSPRAPSASRDITLPGLTVAPTARDRRTSSARRALIGAVSAAALAGVAAGAIDAPVDMDARRSTAGSHAEAPRAVALTPRVRVAASLERAPVDRPSVARASAALRGPAPSCSPPYLIDDEGVRVPKTHCF